MASTNAMATAKKSERYAWYSVWAIPPEPVASRLRRVMRALRSEYGGPEFEPHITVFGAMCLTRSEAMSRFHASCDSVASYTIDLLAVTFREFFYKCLFLVVNPTHQVMKANEQCTRHFDCETDREYMPHLSLLYGYLRSEEKERAMYLVEAMDYGILNMCFEVSEFALYKTDLKDTTLKSWEKVASCKLKGKA